MASSEEMSLINNDIPEEGVFYGIIRRNEPYK